VINRNNTKNYTEDQIAKLMQNETESRKSLQILINKAKWHHEIPPNLFHNAETEHVQIIKCTPLLFVNILKKKIYFFISIK
jgi:hypothetical protein